MHFVCPGPNPASLANFERPPGASFDAMGGYRAKENRRECDFVHKLIGESSPNLPSIESRDDGHERSSAIWQSSDFDAGDCGGACRVRAGLSENGATSSAWQRLAMQPDGSSDELYAHRRASASKVPATSSASIGLTAGFRVLTGASYTYGQSTKLAALGNSPIAAASYSARPYRRFPMWAGAGHRPASSTHRRPDRIARRGHREKDSTSLFLDVDLLLRFDFVLVQTAEGVTGFLRCGSGSVVAETFAVFLVLDGEGFADHADGKAGISHRLLVLCRIVQSAYHCLTYLHWHELRVGVERPRRGAGHPPPVDLGHQLNHAPFRGGAVCSNMVKNAWASASWSPKAASSA